MCRRRSGFTLIELLVVIAIIAILAAILFPVYARAKEKGREVSCKSQMKQIAYAMQMYLDEWNSCFPDQTSVVTPVIRYQPLNFTGTLAQSWLHNYIRRYKNTDGSPAGIGWTLRPYIKSLNIFKCASEPKTRPNYPQYAINCYPIYSSYYVKFAMCYYANKIGHPIRLGDVMYPLRAVMIFEEGWHGNSWPYLWEPLLGNTIPSPGAGERAPFVRINAVYFDCHVGNCSLPYIRAPFDCYCGSWYWYLADESRYPDAQGMDYGWDLSKGVHDKQ